MVDKNSVSSNISRVLISSNMILKNIILLDQNSKNYSSSYYISLTISNLFPQNSKIFNFEKTGKTKLNQILSLKNEETKKKYIKLELYEKDNIYSNLILKGEIKNENYIYDNSSEDFICYLYNSENEEKAVIHYDIDYDYMNTNDLYDKNVKRIKRVLTKQYSNERNINNLFLINFQYIKLINNDIHSIINWQDKWRTLAYLFAITFIIIFFKIFFVFVLPLYLIFFHIKNKNNIENFIITRNSVDEPKNKEENNMVLFKIMLLFNKIIKIYENIIKKIINGKALMTELYIRIGVTILVNFFFFYFRLYRIINFKILILSIIWFYVLRMNPSFYSFSVFIFNLIEERTLFISTNNNFFIYKTNLINLITILIPFYSLYHIYNNELIDDSEFISDKNELNKNNLIKYEIYENERWWMFVGWNKNLILDEANIWCKVEKPKEYCDKEMIKLPGNKNYKWENEWKIEINDNSDKNGWEYSYDFNNKNFGRYNGHQYVRRRKWVRYASGNQGKMKKIE